MKHITFADKNLLSGDEVADLLLEYAAALANASKADTVSVNCIGADGNEVVASFLLGEASPLMIESASNKLPEPDNSAAVEYMRDKVRRVGQVPRASSIAEWDLEEASRSVDY